MRILVLVALTSSAIEVAPAVAVACRPVDQIVGCRDGSPAHIVALLDAVAIAMPHYPLDAAFVSALPFALIAYYEQWETTRPLPPNSAW